MTVCLVHPPSAKAPNDKPASEGFGDVVPARESRRRLRRAISVVAGAAFVVLVMSKREALVASFDRLGHPHWTWIPIAVALELASMATLAWIQRRLLKVGGRRVGKRPMMATVLAANALSVSVPVAGPELGTAFTFRRLKKQGADASLASWSLLVGGLVSWVGAILVLVAGGALSGNALITGAAVLVGLLAVIVVLAVRAGLRRPRLRCLLVRAAGRTFERVARLVSHPVDQQHDAVEGWLDRVESLRLSRSGWVNVGGMGLANWLTDAGVLVMSVLAVGAPVPWRAVLLVYGVATIVGSAGITPGGIGVVEATLCVGLVRSGLTAGKALGAVLLYRLISFWLVATVGWLVLLYLRLERPARSGAVQGVVPS